MDVVLPSLLKANIDDDCPDSFKLLTVMPVSVLFLLSVLLKRHHRYCCNIATDKRNNVDLLNDKRKMQFSFEKKKPARKATVIFH